MSRLLHGRPAASVSAPAIPTHVWLVIVAAVIAALLLLLAGVDFTGLDRLLPDGAQFLPYFTT
jgi:hypothetical protein